jgi:hypothetical protein
MILNWDTVYMYLQKLDGRYDLKFTYLRERWVGRKTARSFFHPVSNAGKIFCCNELTFNAILKQHSMSAQYTLICE